MEERELIRSILQGKREEYRKIVLKHSASARALAQNILGNRQDAEDACQEAFVQAFHRLADFDPRLSFKAWLFTILYRRCCDILRKRRRARDLYQRLKEQPERLAFQPGNPSPLSPALKAALLDQLSPGERTALSLWANEGWTSKEIGRMMGCSPSTARVYLFQARKKIKARLEGSREPMPPR